LGELGFELVKQEGLLLQQCLFPGFGADFDTQGMVFESNGLGIAGDDGADNVCPGGAEVLGQKTSVLF